MDLYFEMYVRSQNTAKRQCLENSGSNHRCDTTKDPLTNEHKRQDTAATYIHPQTEVMIMNRLMSAPD